MDIHSSSSGPSSTGSNSGTSTNVSLFSRFPPVLEPSVPGSVSIPIQFKNDTHMDYDTDILGFVGAYLADLNRN